MELVKKLRIYKFSESKKSIAKRGKKNPQWKNGTSKTAIHHWAKIRLPRPDLCVRCKLRKAVDLANISGKYKRHLSDWEYLCRKCHMEKDGRLAIFLGTRKSFQYGHAFHSHEQKQGTKI